MLCLTCFFEPCTCRNAASEVPDLKAAVGKCQAQAEVALSETLVCTQCAFSPCCCETIGDLRVHGVGISPDDCRMYDHDNEDSCDEDLLLEAADSDSDSDSDSGSDFANETVSNFAGTNNLKHPGSDSEDEFDLSLIHI